MKILLAGLVLSGMLAAAACAPSEQQTAMRAWGERRTYRITPDPAPPHAMEPTRYKVVVTDRATGQPVQEGEGRIFATSQDGANADDGLAKGDEVGTYYARLFFVTAGDWAVALQFRADSTERLERVDWMQSVLPERELGR